MAWLEVAALAVAVNPDDGCIDHGVLHVRFVAAGVESRLKTSAFTRSRNRTKTVFHLPKEGGRSRQGLLVRAIHKTASTNSRLSFPLRPGSVGLPRQWGCIFAHWASVKTKRSLQSLNHAKPKMGNPKSQQTLVWGPTRASPRPGAADRAAGEMRTMANNGKPKSEFVRRDPGPVADRP